ncbi:MAG: TetR/AcrR family transcriptional regulator [Bacteroidota bacterium]|nr:TetR/AcrR family transcriptional regulator [Bacteroidota bacterium]
MSNESNPKRELILKTGKKLFWKFGFKRVTVEEICKEAGVSKMTYYKYFTNKMALVKTLMDDILQDGLIKYRKLMDSGLPYPEKVLGMIELKREQTHTMSSEFFKDYLQSGDPELIAYLEKLSNENLQIFVADFRKAQENGDIRKDLKVEFIIAILNQLMDWVQHDKALLELYDEPQDLAVELTRFMFYGMLEREK